VKITKQPRLRVSVKVNRAKVGAKFKRDSPAAIAALEKVPADEIAGWLSGEEKEFMAGAFAVERDMVEVEEAAQGYAIAQFEGGRVFLKTEIKKELYEEAMVREVARRVQLMRKERGLVEADRIALHVHTDERELAAIVKKRAEELCSQVNAGALSFARHAGAKEWEIGEAKVEISFEKK
jgi:isoleucyl-tRNA synthetase